MAIGDSDLAVFFGDFGRVVVFDGASVKATFDAPAQDAAFGKLKVSDVEYSLKMPFNAFAPMPRVKDRLTVDGSPYQVSSLSPMDDGAIVEVRLRAL